MSGKESGLGQALYIQGRDVSGETQKWDVSGGFTPMDVTGLRKRAPERIAGLKSGTFKYSTFFDPASAGYDYLVDLPTTDAVLTMAHRETLGAPAMSMVAKQLGYNPSRDTDGKLMFEVEEQSNASFPDWGVMLTAGMRQDGAATNGTGVDFAAAHAFGLQAYLHVFSFTGTSVTVKLQGSSDNGAGDAYADIVGGSFGAQTAVGASRITTTRALAVERYMRVVTTGVFTEATFAVMVAVNQAQVNL